jgi:hypothetical protein
MRDDGAHEPVIIIGILRRGNIVPGFSTAHVDVENNKTSPSSGEFN